jgi:hypothetical protein
LNGYGAGWPVNRGIAPPPTGPLPWQVSLAQGDSGRPRKKKCDLFASIGINRTEASMPIQEDVSASRFRATEAKVRRFVEAD